ncbi:MAG: ATP-binding protein, partial [Methanobrevibacter sp.]|nr:ATP-binding protein [Methanobrevibacter sp.]
PLSIDSFEEIIEDNYIYVDKTKEIWKIIEKRKKYHFLSRPRRFGKSLLISTMKELFLGNEKLFKNLYIHDKWDWNKLYPVLHFDMSKNDSTSPENLEKSIIHSIEKIAKKKQINIDKEISLKDKFIDLIEGIYESAGEKLVVLVDEYDKPILDYVDNLKIANENREVLKSFYTILKSSGQYIHFVFITGVSKFSQTSIFSGLNTLKDLSLNERYSTICGYTQDELINYFDEFIAKFAKNANMTKVDLIKEIEINYDGYSWDGDNFLYNPYSILSALDDELIFNYWFESGTPTFLLKLIQKENYIKSLIKPVKVKSNIFKKFEIENLDKINLTTILMQTGYLTIKNIKKSKGKILEYTLDIPNKEVHDSIFEELITLYTNQSIEKISNLGTELLKSIKNCDNENFNKDMKILLSKISYFDHKKDESFYHAIFLSFMSLLGFHVQGEILTNIGRIDVVLLHENIALICEIKYDENKSFNKVITAAMNQIIEKKYYEPYMDKKVILLALVFGDRTVQGELKPFDKESFL